MERDVKRPRWTSTATVGLVLLIVLIFLAFSFISSLFPKKDKSVTPQVSQVAFSLTEAQQKEIMLLVSPLIELDTVGFHSLSEADAASLTDGAILRLLKSNKTFRLDSSGILYINAADVAAEYELIYGEVPDFTGYDSEIFSYNAESRTFSVQTEITDDAAAEPAYVTAPEALFPETKELSILSASAADGIIKVTLSATDEETHKYEISLTDNGGYVLVSFLEV